MQGTIRLFKFAAFRSTSTLPGSSWRRGRSRAKMATIAHFCGLRIPRAFWDRPSPRIRPFPGLPASGRHRRSHCLVATGRHRFRQSAAPSGRCALEHRGRPACKRRISTGVGTALDIRRQAEWAGDAPDMVQLIWAIRSINLLLLVFNMLPVYPLDGGQILQALLWFPLGGNSQSADREHDWFDWGRLSCRSAPSCHGRSGLASWRSFSQPRRYRMAIREGDGRREKCRGDAAGPASGLIPPP